MADSQPKAALPPRYKRPMPTFKPFKEVEATRPPFVAENKWHYTQTPNTEWKVGGGATTKSGEGKKWVTLDPADRNRDPIDNYSLMIAGYGPRPVAFASTLSKDGEPNLSPFSYTTMINHDPPMMIIGFSPVIKNTFKNIIETGEVTVNMISEDFLEAANFTCIDAPYGTSEWLLSGLTQGETKIVKPARVAEAVFSIECKLRSYELYENADGVKNGGYAVLEGVMFHIREDALIDDGTNLDQGVLKNVVRMGGITYGRVTEGIELPRPMWSQLTDEEKKVLEKK